MPKLKSLLILPAIGGSLAFACGRDARPAASADAAPKASAGATAPAQKACPDAAVVSHALGTTVKFTGQGTGCMYTTDDETYESSMILGGAGSGAQLMREVQEEADGRQARTESPGVGDRGLMWAARGNAAGAVVGNGKSAYVEVTMDSKDPAATKAALLELLRKVIE